MRHLEKIQRDASLVSPAQPLRVETAGLLVLVEVDRFVDAVYLVLLAPVFGVLELNEGFLWDELSRSQVAEERFVVVTRGLGAGRCRVVSF